MASQATRSPAVSTVVAIAARPAHAPMPDCSAYASPGAAASSSVAMPSTMSRRMRSNLSRSGRFDIKSPTPLFHAGCWPPRPRVGPRRAHPRQADQHGSRVAHPEQRLAVAHARHSGLPGGLCTAPFFFFFFFSDVLRSVAYCCKWSRSAPGCGRDLAGDTIESLLEDQQHLQQRTSIVVSNCEQYIQMFIDLRSMTESEKSASQLRAIVTFTVVTVIFLPLSFMASIFSINSSDFIHGAKKSRCGPWGAMAIGTLLISVGLASWDHIIKQIRSCSYRMKEGVPIRLIIWIALSLCKTLVGSSASARHDLVFLAEEDGRVGESGYNFTMEPGRSNMCKSSWQA